MCEDKTQQITVVVSFFNPFLWSLIHKYNPLTPGRGHYFVCRSFLAHTSLRVPRLSTALRWGLSINEGFGRDNLIPTTAHSDHGLQKCYEPGREAEGGTYRLVEPSHSLSQHFHRHPDHPALRELITWWWLVRAWRETGLSLRIPCQDVEDFFISSWGRRLAKGFADFRLPTS